MGKVPHWKAGPHRVSQDTNSKTSPRKVPSKGSLLPLSWSIPTKLFQCHSLPGFLVYLSRQDTIRELSALKLKGLGKRFRGEGIPWPLTWKQKQTQKIKTHTHTKQVIPLENMRKWVVWNHWFCPFSVLQLASTVRKTHVLLTYTSICWVTSRPGCDSVLWGLRRSAADRQTAIWVLTCHPEPLWFPWIPPRNRILGHEIK